MASLVGRRLGNYEIEDELGRGGMGVVWLARQTSLDRPAVLKRIRPELREHADLAERFAREARTAAAIHHPNVVAVYDRFASRGHEYIAQEYVDGADLATVLKRCGPLPPRVATMIALAVARGLEEIHGQGTVHRDLKPHNILVGRRGEVKIADFGLALDARAAGLTQPGVMLGSPPYMPPEQMLGERVDARCDLFSLGVMLYELLTNQLPYPEPRSSSENDVDGDDTASLLKRMQKERYASLRSQVRGVPRTLRGIVRGCLKANVKRRAASAAGIRRKLERELGNPSPVDMQRKLAGWLWERQVFECRNNETVVQASEPFEREPSMNWAAALAAAAIVFALSVGVITAKAKIEASPAFEAMLELARIHHEPVADLVRRSR